MSGKYLTLKDRRLIAKRYGEEARVLDIANEIGCHPATIYEELRRGGHRAAGRKAAPGVRPPDGPAGGPGGHPPPGEPQARRERRQMKEDNDMKQKNMELCRVRQGEAFTFDGVRFVKLDESAGAAFVVAEDVMLENIPFEHEDAEREDHNNYTGSNLERESVSWLMKEHPATFGAAVQRPIDLTTMDGMTDYGMPTVTVRALTIDEYRKYRQFIPLASKPYWLATGWTTKSSPFSDANYAYYVDTVGTLLYYNVGYAYFAARPALYLKSSILVSVDTEDEGKVLTDYSDSELIDELYRRRRATYDPD